MVIQEATFNDVPPAGLGDYVLRVARRPRPLLVLYALTTLSALLVTLLLTAPVLPLARYPLLREALAARSLDGIADLAQGPLETVTDGSAGALSTVGLVALLAALLVGPAARAYLQGSALSTYAAAEPLTWGAFLRAGWRWLGTFLLLDLGGTLLALLTVALFGALAFFLSAVRPLAWLAGGVGLLLVGAIVTWVEMARAAAVVRDDRHLFRALRAGGRRALDGLPALLGLLALGLLLQALLYGLSRVVTGFVAIPAWLPSFVLLQAIALARLAVRLGRWSGEVGLVFLEGGR